MAQTTNKYQIIQKVSATDTALLHPETEAAVVLYSNADSTLTATNLQGAVDEVASKVKAIEDGGVVNGIKGNAETEYRKGEVNLTAANIGAEPSGAIATHNTNASAHNDIRTAVASAQSRADSAYTLAEGRARAVSFATVAEMTTALKAAANTAYKVGDNLFIKATGSPDYWVSGVLAVNTGTYGFYELSELETQKVDLSGYQTKTDATLATTDKTVTGAIGEVKATADTAKTTAQTNSTAITNIVNGTTKIAKAATADNATLATTATSAGKWTAAKAIGVSVNSGTNSVGAAISASGSQSVDGSADKTIAVTLGDSGIPAGTYSAVQINTKGIAVAGGQMAEIGASGQSTPSANLATGGLFFKLI